MFSTAEGGELDAANVRRDFRRVVKAPGLNAKQWTPRELRHSFVSLLSDSGRPIEQISRLVGHNGSAVTERVYRHPTTAGSPGGCTGDGWSVPWDVPEDVATQSGTQTRQRPHPIIGWGL